MRYKELGESWKKVRGRWATGNQESQAKQARVGVCYVLRSKKATTEYPAISGCLVPERPVWTRVYATAPTPHWVARS